MIFCVTYPDRGRQTEQATNEESMSKSSTVTVRARPVEEVASAAVAGLTIHGETITFETDQRI